ncbi:MAG: stage II sporulation protein P [Methylocystaceae bacterium]
MEANLRHSWLISMLAAMSLLVYMTLAPGSKTVHEFQTEQPALTQLNNGVLAAGYAGLGEGWGLQVLRTLTRIYAVSGVCALELPSLLGSNPVSAAESQEPDQSSAAAGKPILIYCTHSTESYVPDDGVERTEGRPGLIMEVARTLGDELEKLGFDVTISEELHDWPDFTNSYGHSRVTVQDYLALHPDAAAIIDVHRDAFPDGSAVTTKVNGTEAAPVLLILGTDQRKPHPNWRENLEFATRLNETAKKDYPGLVRGIRTKAGVYNQDLSVRSILIEFGTDGNKLSQAKTSALAIAQVIARTAGSDDN